MSAFLASQAPVASTDDYRVAKTKPGRKISCEPAKNKRNEQVRNAQRKYRAKNKQKMETLEIENEELLKKVRMLEDQVKLLTAIASSQLTLPTNTTTTTAMELQKPIELVDTTIGAVAPCDELMTIFDSDLMSAPSTAAGQSIDDHFIDDLYDLVEQDEKFDESHSASQLDTDKIKFVFYSKSSEVASSINLSSIDTTATTQTHQFINTANCCNSQMNSNDWKSLIETPNAKIEDFGDFVSGAGDNNKDNSDMDRIFAKFMADGVSIEELFGKEEPDNGNSYRHSNNNEQYLDGDSYRDNYKNYDQKNNFEPNNDFPSDNDSNGNNNNGEQVFDLSNVLNNYCDSLANDNDNECDVSTLNESKNPYCKIEKLTSSYTVKIDIRTSSTKVIPIGVQSFSNNISNFLS